MHEKELYNQCMYCYVPSRAPQIRVKLKIDVLPFQGLKIVNRGNGILLRANFLDGLLRNFYINQKGTPTHILNSTLKFQWVGTECRYRYMLTQRYFAGFFYCLFIRFVLTSNKTILSEFSIHFFLQKSLLANYITDFTSNSFLFFFFFH